MTSIITVKYNRGRSEQRQVQGTFEVFEPRKTVKIGDIAYPHVGIEVVEEYLKTRDSDESALFLDRDGRRFSENNLSRLLKGLGVKTGSSNISAQSLRKFHWTRLEGVGMPEQWVKKL